MNFIQANTPTLPLMEAFYTIQGEGHQSGKAAYFIRLAGCDIGCPWCDVKESWDVENHPARLVDDIINNAAKYPSKIVIITGGEPLSYNLDYLTAALKKRGMQPCLETSGAYPLSGSWDWICLSPKKMKAPKLEVSQLANELKVIIFNQSDFLWAEQQAKLVAENCLLYLQPEWSRMDLINPLIVSYVKENPKWKISLQVHKYLHIQ